MAQAAARFGSTSLAALCFACAVMFAFSSADAKTVMTLAYSLPEGSTYDVGAKKFKELVESRTNGEVELRIICCGRLGSDEDEFRRIEEGSLDGAILGLNLVGPFVANVDTFFLPYMFKDLKHLEHVMLGPIGAKLHAEIREKTGVEVIGYTDFLFRNLYNSKRDINSLKDVAGLKYRVPRNEVMIQTYQAFGAEATPLGFAETFSATQTGIVDGGDLAAIHLYQSKIYEVAKHMAVTEHFVLISGFFVGDKFLSKLPAKTADIIRAAGPEAGAVARAFGYSTERDAVEKLKAAGVVFTHPDKAEFIAAVKPVWDRFVKERGPKAAEVIKEIEATASSSN